jgi:O-antigen/teichoic acid export membrane protein
MSALRARLSIPLYRNGYALVASTAATSVLGLGYWLLAARTYSPERLGLSAGLISAMTLLANLAQLNLKGALNRFLPTAGREAPALTLRAYAVSLTLAAVAALVFVLGAGVFSPRLATLLADPLLAIWFVVATMAWTIFVLQDAVLAGIRRAGLVPVENLAFSVGKIGLLLVLASAAPVTGAFLSWSAPVVALIIPVNLIVFRRLMPAHARSTDGRERPASTRVMAGYLAADTLAYAIWTLTTGLLPLLVLNIAGPEANAQFFVVWAIAYALYLASTGMGQSLLAEAALDPAHLREHARKALIESLRIVVPAVVVVLLIAPFVLGWLGGTYDEEAVETLRMLALSAIPYAVLSAEINVARAQRRMRFVIATYASLCGLVFALGLPMLARNGIEGLGVGWLVAQSVVAVGVHLRHRLPRLRGRRLMAPLVVEHGPLVGRRPGGGDTEIYELERAFVHVGAARAAAPAHFALAPRRLGTGTVRGRDYTVESTLPGRSAEDALAGGLAAERLLATIHAAIRPLHESTRRDVRVREDHLHGWVDAPLDRLEALLGPARRPALRALRAELRDALEGRRVQLCHVHGDLWPGNVLLDDAGAVSGIVDWEASSRDGLAEVEHMHLLLTTRAVAAGRELGDVVAETLRRRLGGEGAVTARTAVLLAWLGHVDANLTKSARYARNPAWRHANLLPVVETVGRQAALNGRLPRPVAVPRAVPRTALAVAAAGLGCLLWALGVQAADWRAMTDVGLVSVLPPVAFVGLALLPVAFALSDRVRPGLLITLVALLHATPPLLYGTVRYSWSYKHVGIVDYIERHGWVDPGIAHLPVYHDWPGFFLLDAVATGLSGIPVMTQALWAPLLFNLLDVGALLYLLRGLTGDRRVHWVAAWLFFAASWIGQDYFAPQAFAFCLYLLLMGAVVRGRRWLAVGLVAAIAVSHPLTGVMAVLGLAALALAGVRPARSVTLAAAAIVIGWDLTFAGPYVRPHLTEVLGSIDLPWATTGESLASAATLSAGQHVVALAGRGLVLAMLALAALGTLRAHRARRLSRPAALLAVAPVALFAAGDYDGEMIFRIYLFALAPLAFLAAHAFGRSRLALGAVSAALLGAFLFAHYGKDHQYVFTPQEVAASRFVYDHAPRGTLLVEGTPNYPAQFSHYEYFTHVPLSREPRLADPARQIAGWLEEQPGYVILTRSQRIDAAEVGTMPVAEYDRIRAALLASPRFRVAFRNRDAVVLQRASKET